MDGQKEEQKIIEDATNFLFFVKELSANLPAKAIQAFKTKDDDENLSTENDNGDDSDTDSGFGGSSEISPREVNAPLLNCDDMNLHSSKKETKKFECLACGKFFKRRSSLSTHKLIHLNVKPFTCTICSKEFLRRSDLKKHALMHSGQKPHECPECKKVFSQSSNMLTHMRRHTGVRPFSCNICGHAFYRKVDVRRHQQRHLKENAIGLSITIPNK